MNTAMIWHIVKKDVRHTWMWILVVLVLFAGFSYVYSTTLLACCPEPIRLWTNAYKAMSVVLMIAIGLFLAMLFHAEALPGTRQYWLARPMNWPDLLVAKIALALAVLLPSFMLMMISIVISQGFEIRGHIPQLLLRLVTVPAIVLMPAFALLAVTKNLQQVSMWLVGSVLALVMVDSMLSGHRSGRVSTYMASLVLVFLPLIIVIAQYALRQTQVARIGLILSLCLVNGLPPLLPIGFDFAVQQKLAPIKMDASKGRIDFDQKRPMTGAPNGKYWDTIYLPVHLSGLGANEFVEMWVWSRVEVHSKGEKMEKPRLNPYLLRIRDDYWIGLPIVKHFLDRHANDATEIKLSGGMSLYGNRKSQFAILSAKPIGIPGIGRCDLKDSVVSCSAPFQLQRRIQLYFGSDPTFMPYGRLLNTGATSTLDLNFSPFPIENSRIELPRNLKFVPNDQIEFETAELQSFAERKFEVQAIRLADYLH